MNNLRVSNHATHYYIVNDGMFGMFKLSPIFTVLKSDIDTDNFIVYTARPSLISGPINVHVISHVITIYPHSSLLTFHVQLLSDLRGWWDVYSIATFLIILDICSLYISCQANLSVFFLQSNEHFFRFTLKCQCSFFVASESLP